MEVYVLDSLLRRTAVIDRFESMIWTERYSDVGDFELVIHSSVENRSILSSGTRLAINLSKRVMTVETIEDKDDSEGRSLLKISGRSLESLLDERAAYKNDNGSTLVNYTVSDTPTNIARSVFAAACVNNTLYPSDNLPFYTPGSLYPADTMAEIDTIIDYTLEIDSVLGVIKELSDIYGFGFRITRGPDDSTLYFNVYTGSDRTTQQNDLGAVIFSPDLDTLTEVSKLTSVENYKNVAMVFGKNGSTVVYALGAETASGFDRRVLIVKADDIDLPAGPELQAALEQKGKDELAKARNISAIDGQVPQFGRYKYEVDYNLGDLVEMRNADGITNNMRVTEQIFVDDSEGERSYPTLAVDLFITPGSWYAWDFNQVWDELGTEPTWDTA